MSPLLWVWMPGAWAQPAPEEMPASEEAADEVEEAADEVEEAADEVEDAVDEVEEAADEVEDAVDEVEEAADEVEDAVDEVEPTADSATEQETDSDPTDASAAADSEEPAAEIRLAQRAPPRFEVGFEFGTMANADRAYDLFSSGNAMPSRGIRIGARLAERVQVLAGWQQSSRGSTILLANDDTEIDFTTSSNEVRAAFSTHQVAAGLRADLSVLDTLLPYVAVQGLAIQGTARLDDDPESQVNVGQVRASALGMGLLAVAGAELRFPPDEPLAVGFHLDLGYAYVSSLSLGDFGTMQPGGFTARGGVGLRF